MTLPQCHKATTIFKGLQRTSSCSIYLVELHQVMKLPTYASPTSNMLSQ